MTQVVSNVVYEVLGRRFHDLDQPIIDYIVNVLADEDFDFGTDGEGAVDAIGELLVDSGCVDDNSQCRFVCSKLSERFGKHGLVKPKPAVRSLLTPLRMFDGMDEEEAPKKKVEVIDGPVLTERDRAKIERRKRKDERQREMQYQMHLQEMEATKAGMPTVCVSHDGGGIGPNIKDLHLVNFSVSVGGRELIVDGSVTLSFGRHYGLVGRNGTGKTTFLRHLAMHAIDGIPKNCQILHVEQEVVGDTTTALQCVLNTDVERIQLLEEEARLLAQQRDLEEGEAAKASGDEVINKDFISQRLEQIYKRLEHIDADSAEARAASILAGLSFTPEMQQKPTKTFSGGWRMRIALARALFIEPDLLLLDEPTNHLDLHAVLWLEAYLLKWKKTFIVVSHAREFLNTVVTDILHLQNQKLTAYKGDYDTFERTRQEQMKNQQKAFESNERSRAHMQTFIDKFRYNVKRAAFVQSRIKALDRLDSVDEVVNDPDYTFEFPTPDDRPGPPIISLSDASFEYPGGPLLFKNLNFGIALDNRIARVGPNGIGKSTILKLIAGELQPSSGTVFRSAKVHIAVFSPHHVDGLELSSNPLLYMMRCYPGVPEQKLRSHLGSLGVTGNLALQPMYILSGGQKSRVAFAKITFKKPHIILLDRPSNHRVREGGMPGLICNACNKEFEADAEQKLHYKSNEHRYNLQRTIAGIPGATEALFVAKQAALAAERGKENESPMLYRCGLCNKGYRSAKVHAQHLQSRAHILQASQVHGNQSEETIIIKPLPQLAQNSCHVTKDAESAESVESDDEWEEVVAKLDTDSCRKACKAADEAVKMILDATVTIVRGFEALTFHQQIRLEDKAFRRGEICYETILQGPICK